MGCVWGIGGSVSGGGDSAAFCSSQGRVPGTGPCPGVDPRGVPTRRPVVWGPLCSGARRLGMEEPALKGIPGECPGGGSPALAPTLSHLPQTPLLPSRAIPFPRPRLWHTTAPLPPARIRCCSTPWRVCRGRAPWPRVPREPPGRAAPTPLCGHRDLVLGRNFLRFFCQALLSCSRRAHAAEASRWVRSDPAALLRSIFSAPEEAKAILGAEGRLEDGLKYFL